ncbi:MAG: hypothetical protein Q4G30_04775 [Actinomycetaceae bacterium]|nr:hypothetical protein [Actinomycetaceae bacterium]
MQDWALMALASTLTVLVLIVPGNLLARISGLRGMEALVLSAPLTIGVTIIVAQVLTWLSIPFSPLTFALTWLLVLVIAVLLLRLSTGRWLRESSETSHPTGLTALRKNEARRLAVFWVLGAILALLPIVMTLDAPGRMSQFHDSMFHFSGAVEINKTGAAPIYGALPDMFGGRQVYYPAVWHTLAALFIPFASAPFVTNAMLFAITAFVWPLGVIALARFFAPQSPRVSYLAALLTPATIVYPIFEGFLRSLYPFALGMALLPASAYVLWRSADLLQARNRDVSRLWWFFAAIALGATALSHPSMVGFLALMLVVALVQWVAFAPMRPRTRVVSTVVLLASILAAIAVFNLSSTMLRRAGMAVEDGDSLGRAIATGLLSGQPNRGSLLAFGVITIAVLIGLITLARKNKDLRPGLYVLAVALLTASTKLPGTPIHALTGFWYGSYDRIAAGNVILMPALGALGIAAVLSFFEGGKDVDRTVHTHAAAQTWGIGSAPMARHAKAQKPQEPLAIGLMTVALIFGITGAYGWADKSLWIDIAYTPGKMFHAPWASEAELAAMVHLPKTLEGFGEENLDDIKVIGDPSSGAGLVYSLARLDSVFPRLGPTGWSEEQIFLSQSFRDIHTNPEVCQIVRKQGITHYYSDDAALAPGEYAFTGLHDVDTSQGFVKVADLDKASLWRITACLADAPAQGQQDKQD